MVKVTDQIDIMNENNHETAHGLHAKKEIDHPDIANEHAVSRNCSWSSYQKGD